jgi:DNA ligase-1
MTKLAPYQIIQMLQSDNSRLVKERIIEQQVKENNDQLFEGFNLALSPYVTFGVKQVPKHGGPDGQGLPWNSFKQLCHLLQTRQLTGHAARDAIELSLSAATQVEWNDWYRRILTKDLKCGVSEKTINKVVEESNPDYVIKGFACMLAHDGAKHEKKIVGKKLLEPKLDGVRVLTVVDMESRIVTQYTRNGKILENFAHITRAIESNIDLIGRSMVLDGEMISSSFQALMKQVHRKENVQAEDAVLVLFDMLPLSEFKNKKSIMGQKRRSELLRSMEPVFNKMGSIQIIPQKSVNLDEFVGEIEFKEFNKQMINQGYEGIMIKDLEAKYECKRSTSWLKQKPFIEVSLTVVGIKPGTGKNEGKAGAFIAEGIEDGKKIQASVGSGLADEEIDQIDENVIGQVIEVRADAITQNQDGSYSLRFPRFLKFRGFKNGEKI